MGIGPLLVDFMRRGVPRKFVAGENSYEAPPGAVTLNLITRRRGLALVVAPQSRTESMALSFLSGEGSIELFRKGIR